MEVVGQLINQELVIQAMIIDLSRSIMSIEEQLLILIVKISKEADN